MVICSAQPPALGNMAATRFSFSPMASVSGYLDASAGSPRHVNSSSRIVMLNSSLVSFAATPLKLPEPSTIPTGSFTKLRLPAGMRGWIVKTSWLRKTQVNKPYAANAATIITSITERSERSSGIYILYRLWSEFSCIAALYL